MKYILFILMFFASPLYADNIYVDQTSADCTGNYSIAARSCTGTDGDSYDTIQEALTAVNIGDVIHMRGGTYNLTSHGTSYASGYYMQINPTTKSGTDWAANTSITLQSYAGEWAIIDGQDSVSNEYPGRGIIGYGDSSVSDAADLAYWKFERFEIKNGETIDNLRAAAFIINGGPIWYRYLYIHDNTAGGEDHNPAGIRMEHMHDSLIEYCYFYNNGTETTNYGRNSSDIVTLSSYAYQASVAGGADYNPSTNVATANNIVRYNYFAGGSLGFKNKGAQLISGRGVYVDDTNNDQGNDIHHNIFQNYAYGGIQARVDFTQVHHNILDDGTWGINLGYEDPVQGMRHIVTYNNTITDTVDRSASGITSDNGIKRKYGTGFTEEASPWPLTGWDYNNIIDNCVSGGRDNDMSITAGSNSTGGDVMDLSTYYNSKNYFYRNPTADIITLTHVMPYDASNSFTQAEFEAQTHTAAPRVAYQNSYDGTNILYEGTTGADKYTVNRTTLHEIETGVTIDDGGVNIVHPYLTGVSIPDYVGAADPNDDDWVAGVLGLTVSYMTGITTDPTWIEGGSEEPSYSNGAAPLLN